MDKLIEALHHPNVWAVSVQLLVLYCVSVGLFFSFDSVAGSMSGPLKDGVKSGKASSQLALFALTAAGNALAVWALVILCEKLETVPRLAMVGLPLLLLVEKHVRLMRAHQDQRRAELLFSAGAVAGIVGAALALMRGCPIK